MLTIGTSLQTDNHTNTSSFNFYRPDALPDTQPTVSKHGRHIKIQTKTQMKYKLKITPRYYVTQTIMRLLRKKTRQDLTASMSPRAEVKRCQNTIGATTAASMVPINSQGTIPIRVLLSLGKLLLSDKTSSQQIVIPNNNKKQCHKVSLIDLGRCDVGKKNSTIHREK